MNKVYSTNGYDVRARVRAFVNQPVAPGQVDNGFLSLNRAECAELLDGRTTRTFDSFSDWVVPENLTVLPYPSAPPVLDSYSQGTSGPVTLGTPLRAGPDSIYPDPKLTPGVINPLVTQDTIAQTIGTPGWTASIRPAASVTSVIKAHIMARDNLPDPASLYELDHFISLELGGHPSDLANLWCQRYMTPECALGGAHEKDHVENFLRIQVISGAMTLADAQRAITDDWYAVYLHIKKYGLIAAMIQYDPSGDADDDG